MIEWKMKFEKEYLCFQSFEIFYECLKNRNSIQFQNQMIAQIVDSSVANFIQKTFEILENKELQEIIHWVHGGREFAIKDIDTFEQNVLPLYFRHRNINSFIRQLNMYGFHKSRKQPTKNIFSHPNFLKGHPEFLYLVKRKIKADDKNEENVPEIATYKLPRKLVHVSGHQTKSLQLMDNNGKNDIKKIQNQETAHWISKKEVTSTLVAKSELIGSRTSMFFKSFTGQSQCGPTPLKSLISKSQIMDNSPQLYSNMRENQNNDDQQLHSEDDLVSIQDQIQQERKVFLNRMSGVSILHTQNLLNDL